MNKFKFDWSSTKKKMTEATASKGFKKDERIYVPEFSKQGTVNVLMRFLPPKRDEAGNLCDVDFPYVGPIYYHNINENKRFLNVNCPTSIGGECPICNTNSDNWDSYTPLQRKRCRNVNYFSNVLILKDHLHPENEGKVFILRYGKKIFEKMNEKSNPSADSLVSQADYWDYYQGANFKYIVKKIKLETDNKAQNNYDSCCFEDSLTPIAKTDEEIESILAKCYDLKPYIAESNFLSKEDLKKKFESITNSKAPATSKTKSSSAPAQEEIGTTSAVEDVVSDSIDSSSDDADNIFNMIRDDD